MTGTWALECTVLRASGRAMGPAGSRHLGAARRRQALRLVESDDMGRVRPRHQERRKVRLQGAARIAGGVCATPSAATSATRALTPSRTRSSNPTARKMLDASILLLPAVGFLPPSDPRVRGTIAAIEKHLMRDGFVLRHDPREVRRQQPVEGAFLACSLWLADAYVLAGEIRQGAGAVRPRGRDCERSRAVGGGVRFRRSAARPAISRRR